MPPNMRSSTCISNKAPDGDLLEGSYWAEFELVKDGKMQFQGVKRRMI
jgi:hypothetical protein